MQSNTNQPPKTVSAQGGTGFHLSRLPRRLFDEARLVCTATWRQTRRLLLLWKASGRVRRTRKAVTEALKAFGEQLHPWDRGDEALRRRIAGLDREIAQNRSEKQPVQRLESERDALFVELAARFMSQGGVAPGLDSKREAVEKAQARHARQERLRSKLRGRCAPADRPTRIRVGAGYALVGAVLLMVCSSAAGPSLPWRSLSILPSIAERAQAQRQMEKMQHELAESARKNSQEKAGKGGAAEWARARYAAAAQARAREAAKTAKDGRERDSRQRQTARNKKRNTTAELREKIARAKYREAMEAARFQEAVERERIRREREAAFYRQQAAYQYQEAARLQQEAQLRAMQQTEADMRAYNARVSGNLGAMGVFP